jgi:hypothetical protein
MAFTVIIHRKIGEQLSPTSDYQANHHNNQSHQLQNCQKPAHIQILNKPDRDTCTL